MDSGFTAERRPGMTAILSFLCKTPCGAGFPISPKLCTDTQRTEITQFILSQPLGAQSAPTIHVSAIRPHRDHPAAGPVSIIVIGTTLYCH
jgi:hypothetical protein